ncbi:adenine deaminase C-terminal domain-containing protein [Metabacillus arenae]|uniref:adenine deaminase n=1 Tax=Metabacillus arenae TaxID=2771434 RepID=A0A926NDQ2_9BACI|nr:adenine deaminase C-terminal domain-containing protein [Metabacillus arenae]MBD1382372.1 adenine deaminase [Metabacillus arenae]
MPEQKYRWKNREIREQIDVVSSKSAPTLILKNGTYLNPYLNKWLSAHIWIHENRIVYVGQKMPELSEGIEVIDCDGRFLVPGYIEPHVHPFQLYNPHSLAKYVSQYGTTTFINDNLFLLLHYDKKKALTLLDQLNKLPVQFYWWFRYDLQTEIQEEDRILSPDLMKKWIEHEGVIQGGELTGWPKLLAGDDLMLYRMQETKRHHKRIEGHFPGASEATLTKMKLFGADCDHEAMTGEEVLQRLALGYHVSLRHSSIRPDLDKLLKEMMDRGIDHYDAMFYTTDGSTPSFYLEGMTNKLIEKALEKGIPAIDAYNMGSYNIAKYYGNDHLIGAIGPGRLANINILENKNNPAPISVLANGLWLRKNGEDTGNFPNFDWGEEEFTLGWDMTIDDLQFSMPMGMKMRNSVIMEPYSLTIDNSLEQLSTDHDESYLALFDRNGNWRINTMLKGFATHVQGLASSYSTTGDILLIGKNKNDMLNAFKRLKEINGGIVLVENGETIQEIPLQIQGAASTDKYEALMEKEKILKELLKERGYKFPDAIYTLLFFSSTHLPFIRITPSGIYDVMKKTVLFPSIMR